jgi:hypothetical protein
MISVLAAVVVLVTSGLLMWAFSSLIEALLRALFPTKRAHSD